MSVTTKQLNELVLKNKDIDTTIKEQLQIIDDKLLHSDRAVGHNCIVHTLPTFIVGISGLDRQDIQRIIYSSIICSLKKRGFTVKICLSDHTTSLYISWKTELDEESINTMNRIIKDNRISTTELHSLVYC